MKIIINHPALGAGGRRFEFCHLDIELRKPLLQRLFLLRYNNKGPMLGPKSNK